MSLTSMLRTANRLPLSLAALVIVLAVAQPAAAQNVQVTAADPPSGEQDTLALVVKITGKNFQSGAQVDFFRSGTTDPSGITVRATRFLSATQIEATVDIASNAALSLFDIRVKLLSGRSGKGSDLFKVVEKGAAGLQACNSGSPQMLTLTNMPLTEGSWTRQVVATEGDVGFYHSLGFDPSGAPTIAYSDVTRDDVRFAVQTAEGLWQSELVDAGCAVYAGISLSYSGEGRPGIAYGVGQLKLAEKTAQGWSLETVTKGTSGEGGTLVYVGNAPHIAFRGGGRGSLSFAYRQGSSWVIEVVDKGVGPGSISLAFDPVGRAVIAYAWSSNRQVFDTLKVAVRQPGGLWQTSTIETGVTGYGVFASLAFSASGKPMIVHGNRTVRAWEWNGDWASGDGGWVFAGVLDPGPFAGGESLAFDGDEPVVSWRQIDTDLDPALSYLKVARREGAVWGLTIAATVQWPSQVTYRTSLALDIGGRPAVSTCLDPQRDLLFVRASEP